MDNNQDYNQDYNDYINDLVSNFIDHILSKKNIFFDSDDYIDVVDYFLVEGMDNYALIGISEGLAQYPDNELLIDLNAEYWISKNDYQKALDIISTIRSPQTEMTFGLYGECYINIGEHDLAVKYFDKYIGMLNDRESKLTAYIDVIEIFKCNRYLNTALNYATKGLTKFVDDKTLLKSKADILFALEYYKEAKDIYNQLLDSYPYEVDYWIGLAEINRAESCVYEALKCYEYISAINPEYEHIEELKAICFIQLSEYENAINILLPEYKKNTDNDDVQFLLANAFFLNDDKSKALPILKKILNNKHHTIFDDTYAMYANCVIELNSNYKEALETLNEGLNLYPDNDKLLYQLGTMEMNLAKELSISNPKQSSKYLISSIGHLKECLNILPDEPQYHFTIARCNLVLSKYEEALHHLTISIENGLEADKIYIFMAVSAWKTQQYDLFEKYYFESKRRYSNYKTLFEQLIPEARDYISKIENL